MSPIIACIAAVFSVAALAFYIVAGVGYYYRGRIFIEGCPWIYYLHKYNGDSEVKAYYGLKGFYIDNDPDYYGFNGFYDYNTKVSTDDDFYAYGTNDDDGTLHKCSSSGKSAFALTVVACIFSFIAMITNGIGGVSEAKVVKAVSAVLSIIACLFGMIAVGVFMTTCYNEIKDGFGDSNDLHYGNGSILVITALICNFFAFVLAIVNIFVGVGHTPLPVADQN
jgi:hypothetical protein